MKKTLTSIIAILALSAALFAQDARQRTTGTIVSDVLAQMPAANYEDFTRELADLAKSAPESIVTLAAMFQPAEKGANNKLEYAVSGVVNFATTPGNEQYREAVAKGLETAIAQTSDKTAKAFFEAELRLLGKPCCKCGCDNKPSDKEILAKAKELDASENENERCQALWMYADVNGAKNAAKVLSALKDSNHAYRMTALSTAESYADDSFFAKLAKAYKNVPAAAKDDILYWLGEQKAESQLPFILKQLNGENANEAIAAAGKIGGEAAANALIGILGTSNGDAAFNALNNFNGDIRNNILSALPSASSGKLNSLIQLASRRHVTEAADQVLDLCTKSDPTAISALAGVVSKDNLGTVASLLDKCGASDTQAFEDALKACVSSLSHEDQYSALSGAMLGAANKEKFFGPIASTATDDAVAMLLGAYISGSDQALSSLATVDNWNAAPILLEASKDKPELLSRYVDLIADSDLNDASKTEEYVKALSVAKDGSIVANLISALSDTPNVKALDAVAGYLDDKDLARDAALAVKSIGVKIPAEVPYEKLEDLFGKASGILSATGNADDSYAVDEMKNTLSNNKPCPVSTLTEEEKKAGFVMLYDGTDLDKWIGDKENYVSMNGAINVFANYGGDGNLYTEKEYHNFIYRFEFCFLRPGVNNGVGVRTPMGVDAAYEGMCEVQILDHDDPMYADLNPYQVHGSAYGIIPAKRLKHKPIGEWSEEEIKVVDNHVTVTVNGEVILDGDLKEACQGHNVDPEGGSRNPYTVDHRNHPGMFNAKGHVSFCGHGKGLKFRNVRILPLD